MTERQSPRRAPYLVRVARARPRLLAAAALGIAMDAALPAAWRPATRFLVSWDVALALYLGLVCHLIARSPVAEIRRRAADEDEGKIAILVLTVVASLASLVAIVAELGSSRSPDAPDHSFHLGLALVTILLSWAFIHTMFALHYAHEFYGEDGGAGGGLTFPGDDEPDYWDFVYFSFVIGMTAQVSDVAVVQKAIRRTVAAHGVVSFVFNAALLALSVNIAASAL